MNLAAGELFDEAGRQELVVSASLCSGTTVGSITLMVASLATEAQLIARPQ